MDSSLLHVVCCYYNPMQWASRLALYQEFESHILSTGNGAKLTTVECQLGDRPFQLKNPEVNHVKVRNYSVLWNKENLLRLGMASMSHTYPDWKYVAWLDADIMFRNPGWANDTLDALQQYQVIQPWETCIDLGPSGEILETHKSFLCQWWKKKPIKPGNYQFPHPGYAWAARRSAIEAVGGLLETAALGAGDHHMALCLINKAPMSMPGGISDAYRRNVMAWQDKAVHHINMSLGFLHGRAIEHFWHGKKEDRKYILRWDIITSNKFDPDTDLKKNTYGVMELAGNKPNLTHDLDIYFSQRNEDGNLI